jgi:hypothetical protein
MGGEPVMDYFKIFSPYSPASTEKKQKTPAKFIAI